MHFSLKLRIIVQRCPHRVEIFETVVLLTHGTFNAKLDYPKNCTTESRVWQKNYKINLALLFVTL